MQDPKSVFRLLVVVVAISVIVGSSIARADDTEISGWVKNALRHDQRVDAKDIEVNTRDGIVSLSGHVPTIASSRFAVREAQKLRGVIGVTNALKIAAEKRSDLDIVRDIEQRIAHNATIMSKGLVVGCLDGYVTLSGEVADYAEELEAELIAEEVRGVKQVQNHLLTGFVRKHSDEQIQRDVMATLARDVYLSGMPVAAKVKNSVVSLSGQVASAYQKQLAEDDVHKLEFVKAVHNNIKVDPSLDNGTRQEVVWPTEEDLWSDPIC